MGKLINQKEGNGKYRHGFAHSEQVCEFTSEYISSSDQLAEPVEGYDLVERSGRVVGDEAR